MSVYTGTQSILNAALGEYQGIGFSLVSGAGLTATLFFKDMNLVVLNLDEINCEKVQEVCANFLKDMTQ